MARKPMATTEAVATAVDELLSEGLDATVERVRAKIGGGSYTTITKALGEVTAARQPQMAQPNDVPADLRDIGARAVASIYSAAQKMASAKVEAVETDARRQIEAANRERSEAAREVMRLESELEQAGQDLESAVHASERAIVRAERAEGVLAERAVQIERLEKTLADTRLGHSEELERLRIELATARAGELAARDEAAELRGQLKAFQAHGSA